MWRDFPLPTAENGPSLFICSAIMTDQQPQKPDASYSNRLNPEDQARVDEFTHKGVNSVERKPFRPIRLLLILIATVTALSVFSQWLPRWAGVY
jgi:hypothetical protein